MSRDSLECGAWSHPAFDRIARVMGARAGLTFPPNRRNIAEAALRRAMHHLGVDDADDFADSVIVDQRAASAALMELTIGETYFFRDPSQWDLVRSVIVPHLLDENPSARGVRAWSAGCASGEEAHTLAIVLAESGCVEPFVLGTDISDQRIARASRAVYTKWSLRGTDDATRGKYFNESGQYFHLRPEYQRARFRTLNLAQPEYGQEGNELFGLDLILCRNVLIYLDEESINGVFARLVASLRVGGWLLVAASDPQPDRSLPLEVVVTDAGLLYRKQDAMSQATVLEPAHVSDPLLEPPYVAEHVPVAAHVTAPEPTSDARRARVAYDAARYDQAIAIADDLIHHGRDDAETWILLARAHANRGDVPGARDAIARAIERYPIAAGLHVVASAIESAAERYGAAAQAARRAVYLDRNLAAAHVALGASLLRIGDTSAADRALRAAERLLLELDPNALVSGSDGHRAAELLAVVHSHRALLEERGSRAG